MFRELWRVLKDDGVYWLNLGDSYSQSGRGGNPADSPHRKQATNRGSISVGAGSQLNAGLHEAARLAGVVSRAWSGKAPEGLKPKDLVGIPWRVAFALQADGWYLRSDIIWAKPNPMPESVTDRPTKAHEYIFLLTKSERYFYDAEAISEACDWDGLSGNKNYDWQLGKLTAKSMNSGGPKERRNKRSVWTVATQPYPEAHYATFPEEIPDTCIRAGSRVGDLVLDPFFGSGTVGRVAEQLNRRWIGIDLGYQDLQKKRLTNVQHDLIFG